MNFVLSNRCKSKNERVNCDNTTGEKAQKGNDKAFIKIFQEYEEDIYRMAFVYVKNQEDALDIVQEVAYQSFKKINTLKQPEYFKTWLMRITINCAVNLVKKNKKVLQFKPNFEEIIASDDDDVLLSITLQELIDNLQYDEKSVVLLKFFKITLLTRYQKY